MNPALRSNLSWTEWGGQYLLFNPQNRATLKIGKQDRNWIQSLNGTHSLQDLELDSQNPNHLLNLIERLCRGNFLVNSEEIFSFLFPKQNTTSWTPSKRQWLFGTFYSKQVQWPMQLQSASALLILSMLTVVGGGVAFWTQQASLAEHPWSIGDDWFWGSLTAYWGASAVLSLGTLLQASMSAAHNPTVTLHLKHTLGIVHLSTDRFPIFHTSTRTQRHYAGVGIAAILFGIGLCWILEATLQNGVGSSVSIAILLLLMWDLCPFYDTNGAQLLETITIHKQRLRTQDFLRSSSLRNPFGEVEGQTGLRITLSIWLLWFGVALHLLSLYVLPHIATLLIQALQFPWVIGQVWLGLVVLLISVYYGYFLFQGLRLSGNLLEQVMPKPVQQSRSVPNSTQYQQWRVQSPDLPDFSKLSAPELLTISENARLDTLVGKEDIWVLIKGQVAYVNPKPEGGFSTLFELPAPSVLLCPTLHKEHPVLWSVSEVSILKSAISSPTLEAWSTVQQRFNHFKEMAPFDQLSDAWKWMLSSQSVVYTIEKDTPLIEAGQPADALYLVLSGTFEVSTSTPIQLSTASIVGEMGLLSEAPRNATVQCVQKGDVLALPAHIFRVCLQQHPRIQSWMQRLVEQRLGGNHGTE